MLQDVRDMKQKALYDQKYSSGYGIQYPEGHIIRIYNYLERKYRLSDRENKNLLDFGCGNGIHSIFFEEKGFRSYGVDISRAAIEFYNGNMKNYLVNKYPDDSSFETRGYCIETHEPLTEVLNCRFDVILANQSLYYLDNDSLERTLNEMNFLLKEDGFVIFTMMSEQNYYYNYVESSCDKTGLSYVKLRGRLNEDNYINFVSDESDLIQKFGVFKKEMVGIYDFTMEEGSSMHYYFIGSKKRGGSELWGFIVLMIIYT